MNEDILKFSISDAYHMLQSSVRLQVNEIELDGHKYVPSDDEENQRIIANELDIDYVELSETLSNIVPSLFTHYVEEEFEDLTFDQKKRIVEIVGGAALVSFMAGVLYQQQQIEIIEPSSN